MLQNKIYDTIVIGASEEGIALCEFLSTKAVGFSVALVSKHFDYVGKNKSLSGIDLIRDEAVFSSYNHGLIKFNLKTNQAIFGKAAVIATGSKPTKASFKSNTIYYKASDIKTPMKNKQAVVYGDNKEVISYALALSKKFKYVYLCKPTLGFAGGEKLLTKLNNTANIVTLPGCNIVGIKNDKEGNLTEITLDTYDTIHCSALVMAIGRSPDVSGISKKMIDLDEQGYAITKAYNETTKVPNIYAIGECVRHNTKQSITGVGNALLSRNK